MAKTKIDEYKCMKNYSMDEKREIIKAFEKLRGLIEEKEKYGEPFEKIVNNETIKYDVHGNGFYTFKAHGKNKSQIRILYKFVRIAEQKFGLEMHMIEIKRRTDKDYMDKFKRYVECYV